MQIFFLKHDFILRSNGYVSQPNVTWSFEDRMRAMQNFHGINTLAISTTRISVYSQLWSSDIV